MSKQHEQTKQTIGVEGVQDGNASMLEARDGSEGNR